MIKYFTLEDQKLVDSMEETAETIWYCVERPTEEEINQLIKQFQIPKDYLTSVLDDAENSRVEEFNQEKLTKPSISIITIPFSKN